MTTVHRLGLPRTAARIRRHAHLAARFKLLRLSTPSRNQDSTLRVRTGCCPGWSWGRRSQWGTYKPRVWPDLPRRPTANDGSNYALKKRHKRAFLRGAHTRVCRRSHRRRHRFGLVLPGCVLEPCHRIAHSDTLGRNSGLYDRHGARAPTGSRCRRLPSEPTPKGWRGDMGRYLCDIGHRVTVVRTDLCGRFADFDGHRRSLKGDEPRCRGVQLNTDNDSKLDVLDDKPSRLAVRLDGRSWRDCSS